MSKNRKRASIQSIGINVAEETNRVDQKDDLRGAQHSSYLKKHWWAVALVVFISLGAFGATLKYLEEDAQRQKTSAKDKSLFSTLNPFVAAPLPSPPPQLSKEFIYAGSRLLAVEDANANAAPPTDLAVWRPTTGQWFVLGGPGSSQVTQTWGDPSDKPVPGDYDGDGKTDFSVFRPSSHYWYIIHSSTSNIVSYDYGATGDLPAQADYDGDGKTDAAVYRPSNYTWYIQGSSVGYYTQVWGDSDDVPASADYDGDGKADLAIWRSSNTSFYWISSVNQGAYPPVAMNQSGEPVSGDYDGDGKADYALFAASSGNWYVRESTTGTPTTLTGWGTTDDKPVPNDYDGDGKIDHTVWRPSNGTWYIRNSQGPSYRYVQWGQNGDVPVPALYRR